MAPREGNFHNGRMPVDDVKAAQRAYVQEICDRLNIKYTELARRAGVSPATLTRFMNDKRYKHALTAKTLHKIESATGVRAPVPTMTLRDPVQVHTVPVVGIAAAGLWKEVALIGEDFAHEEIPIIENHRYAGKRQYGVLIEGNSMNRVFRDGEYAVCVAWDEIGADLQDGQLLHVERSHGGLREVTVKKIRFVNGRFELWPDSDDPRFQTPIDLAHPDDDTEVAVKGLVIGSYRHF